ncbi:hypothetical protein N7495_009083 [Penicillium taxi]|uniref:uncharacterized protein n=1 Tax=Penicillium taxi TaxID=168475 RepID=UPI00254505AB|nr:uncharacterized protein N7495_009083 [Penicillium taxi]KAJ5889042.1 hypothetical protein N7495_009083 [Penicillium taxi]
MRSRKNVIRATKPSEVRLELKQGKTLLNFSFRSLLRITALKAFARSTGSGNLFPSESFSDVETREAEIPDSETSDAGQYAFYYKHFE